MKKAIYLSLIVSLSLFGFSPLVVAAEVMPDDTIRTELVRSIGGGDAPIIKVKWEMNGPWESLLGTDDSGVTGAQILPSGKYQQNTTIGVCAVASDPDGVSDIDSVYADLWYPEESALGPDHEANRQGCGQFMGEFRMTKLDKADGVALFCNSIRTENNNLPVWNENGLYDYDEVCAEDGQLMKETAYVYCADFELSYEDPSGDYEVMVFAQDNAGVDSNYLRNDMRYLELTAFEVDFLAIDYNNVKLNTHKIVNGDLTWDAIPGLNPATVRNIGNTRLAMKVMQDDMGLGKTDDNWNVRYDGRVGSDATFRNYFPNSWKVLDAPLNLSEMDEMDFSIEVFKFPPVESNNNFIGTMYLGATKVSHLTCETS